ncbi:MAG: hypothetical protein AABW92_03425 [Nanoarchaeota archaeon]
MKEEKYQKSLFGLNKNKLRNYMIIGLIVLIGYLINKKFFLMFIFIALTTVGKIVRQKFANSMFMFDPLVFFSILIMKYWGFSYLFFYLFVTVFLADAIAGHLTEGSFLNYFLFHFCPFIAYVFFGKFSLAVFGNVTAILYSVIYFFLRVNFMGGDPFSTGVKAITNIIFVFLYISFLGPIFNVII